MKLSTATRLGLGLGLLALVSGATYAQTPAWTSAHSLTTAEGGRYGLGVAADGSQYTTGTFKNTLVLGTTTLTAGPGAGHVFLAKYSTTGTVLWARQLDSPAALTSKLAVDAAGNIYLAGSFITTLTLGTITLAASGTAAEPYLMKLDAQGVAQWTQQGGGPGRVNGIAIGPSGDVVLTGTFSAALNLGGSALAGGGAYYYRLSPAGAVLQAVPFGQNITPEAVALDTAGNAYLTGEFIGNVTVGTIALSPFSSSSGTSYPVNSDLFLCKIDGSGTVLWAVSNADNGNDAASGVIVDAGGNPVVCGMLENISQAQNGSYRTTLIPYLARYTSQGISLWRKATPTTSGPGQISAVAHDGRGGYLATGSLIGAFDLGTVNIYSRGTGFVIRFDSQGNGTWGKVPGDTYPYASLAGTSIAADGAGTVYVAGNITDVGVVKFDPLPAIGRGMFIAALQPDAVLATQSGSAANTLAVYPNPATRFVTLVLPAGSSHLTILDALGRLMREQELPTGSDYTLPLTGLPPGLYRLRAKLKSGQIAHSQLAVQ